MDIVLKMEWTDYIKEAQIWEKYEFHTLLQRPTTELYLSIIILSRDLNGLYPFGATKQNFKHYLKNSAYWNYATNFGNQFCLELFSFDFKWPQRPSFKLYYAKQNPEIKL